MTATPRFGPTSRTPRGPKIWRGPQSPAASPAAPGRGTERGRASGPRARQAKTDSPPLAAASKPRIQRPSAGAEPAAGAERIVEIHGQEFVMDPDVGDGPE